MLDDFLIVHKEVLPDIFERVIQVKEMMERGDYAQVSEAVKQVGLSRSTYYKYKDHVFRASGSSIERRAILSFILSHEKGILSEVLNVFTSNKCNVLTINQNIPIHNQANVSVSFDVRDMECSLETLILKINAIKGVSKTTLLSIE